mgnify:CR=1 FL=1
MTTTNKASVLLVLLLVLPACGQNVHPPLSDYRCDGVHPHDTLMMRGLEWVTVRVDSLNLGHDNGHPVMMERRNIYTGQSWMDVSGTCLGPDCHDWVYSNESFISEAALPTPGPRESWTERQRECICRVCLRHEWQAQKSITLEPELSPFDSLKTRLSTR